MGCMNFELLVGHQKIRFDRDATVALYSDYIKTAGADSCTCASCRNFALQRGRAYPEQFLLLNELGVNPGKELETFDYDFESSPGYHEYGGWFLFSGEIIEGATFRPAQNPSRTGSQPVFPTLGFRATLKCARSSSALRFSYRPRVSARNKHWDLRYFPSYSRTVSARSRSRGPSFARNRYRCNSDLACRRIVAFARTQHGKQCAHLFAQLVELRTHRHRLEPTAEIPAPRPVFAGGVDEVGLRPWGAAHFHCAIRQPSARRVFPPETCVRRRW